MTKPCGSLTRMGGLTECTICTPVRVPGIIRGGEELTLRVDGWMDEQPARRVLAQSMLPGNQERRDISITREQVPGK